MSVMFPRGSVEIGPLMGPIYGDTKGYIPACLGLFVRDSRIWVGGVFVFANRSEYSFVLADGNIFDYFLANKILSGVE